MRRPNASVGLVGSARDRHLACLVVATRRLHARRLLVEPGRRLSRARTSSRACPGRAASAEPTPAPGARRAESCSSSSTACARTSPRRRCRRSTRCARTGSDLTLTRPAAVAVSFPNWTTILSGAPPHDQRRDHQLVRRTRASRRRSSTPRARRAAAVVVVGPDGLRRAVRRQARPGTCSCATWPKGSYLSGDARRRRARASPRRSSRDAARRAPARRRRGRARVRRRLAGVPRHGGARSTPTSRASSAACRTTRTTFVVAADHGHIDTGGHGGWEDDGRRRCPAVFSGPGVAVGRQGDGHAGPGRADGRRAARACRAPRVRDGRTAAARRSVSATAERGSHPSRRTTSRSTPTTLRWSSARRAGVSEGRSSSHARPRRRRRLARETRLATERAGQAAARRWPSRRLSLLVIAADRRRCRGARWSPRWRARSAYYARLQRAVLRRARLPRGRSRRSTPRTYVQGVHERPHGRGGARRRSSASPSPPSSTRSCARSAEGPQGRSTCPGGSRSAPATVLVVQATLALQVAWFLWQWGAVGHVGAAGPQVGVQVRPRPDPDDRARRCRAARAGGDVPGRAVSSQGACGRATRRSPLQDIVAATSPVSPPVDRWRMPSYGAIKDLREFIALLEQKGQLKRITRRGRPDLEIGEITDRVSKAGRARRCCSRTRSTARRASATRMPVAINLMG